MSLYFLFSQYFYVQLLEDRPPAPLQVDESPTGLPWNKPFECGFTQKQSNFMVVYDLSDTRLAMRPLMLKKGAVAMKLPPQSLFVFIHLN